MRFPWRSQVSASTAHARKEREAAEERLRHAQEHVIIPLRRLREENHVSDIIRELIERRVTGGREDDSGTAHS